MKVQKPTPGAPGYEWVIPHHTSNLRARPGRGEDISPLSQHGHPDLMALPQISHTSVPLQVLSYTCHTFLVPTTFHGCPPPPSHLITVTHALYPVVSHLLPPVSLQCGTPSLLEPSSVSLFLTTSLPLPNSQAPLLPCPD